VALLFPALIWWLIVEILGLAALPLTLWLFRHLPDRGYAFAKPLGILLTSYALWILVTFGFLRNTTSAIAFVVLLVAAGTWHLFGKGVREALRQIPRSPIVAAEALFALAFGLWALFRAYNPEIAATEKPMEFAFLNAILRSESFPPHDPWLSGFAISYYYFGYLMMAMLTKLSGLPANITFNLANALLFALTITGAFSLVYNLIEGAKGDEGTKGTPSSSLLYGFLGSLFVAVIGNLEGLLELLHAKGIGSVAFWQWVDIKDLLGGPPFMSEGWWWWRASRVIHDVILGQTVEVIDEFPFFSFMLGDMHPHVLALPFVLLALALALNILLSKRQEARGKFPVSSFQLIVYALCLGALGFLNSWDLPTYALIVVMACAVQSRRHGGGFRDVARFAIALAALAILLYLPFYIGLQSQAGGLRPVLLVKTKLHQYLVMFGLFIYVVVSLMADGLWHWQRKLSPKDMKASINVRIAIPRQQTERVFVGRRRLPQHRWLTIAFVPLGLVLLLSLAFKWWTAGFLALLIGTTISLLFQKLGDALSRPSNGIPLRRESASGEGSEDSTIFVLFLILVALLLTLSVEFVYVKDVFNSRMNTVFKLYYQAWALLAISSAFGVYYIVDGWRRTTGRYAWLALFAALFAASLVYPAAATYTKANRFAVSPTLDGTAYMERHYPDDYAAIQWLKANVEGAPVVLEAPGGSFTEYGRVSSQTGLPTLLGWGGHELQWRGSYEEPGRREPDIEAIYKGLDEKRVLKLLDEYDVSYVYVGRLEREKYQLSQAQVGKFAKFMDVVYDQGGVRIYKVRD